MQLLQQIVPYVVATRLLAIADVDTYSTPNADLDHPFADFRSMDAQFGPPLSDNGLFGQFVLADPDIGCEAIAPAPFEPKIVGNRTISPILLIKRGQCEFDLKVLNAQLADYYGVIVYNDVPTSILIPMGSQSEEIANQIQIPSALGYRELANGSTGTLSYVYTALGVLPYPKCRLSDTATLSITRVAMFDLLFLLADNFNLVFTTLEAGDALISFLNNSTESAVYVNIIPNGDSPFWPPTKFLWPFAAAVGGCLIIMLVSTVVKLARDWRKSRRGRLSRRKLNQLPIIKFIMEEHGSRFDCCAICLEEFKNGDKIRELPCKHGYHKQCIDPWLTANRKVCPLCKRTVLPSDDSEDSDSEEAPLLPPGDSQNDNEGSLHDDNRADEVRVVGWARGFANQLHSSSRRDRTESVSSYVSTGEVNEAADIHSSDDQQTPTTAIRQPRQLSDDTSNDGDDEDSPRQFGVTI